jgi:hypothetical protein
MHLLLESGSIDDFPPDYIKTNILSSTLSVLCVTRMPGVEDRPRRCQCLLAPTAPASTTPAKVWGKRADEFEEGDSETFGQESPYAVGTAGASKGFIRRDERFAQSGAAISGAQLRYFLPAGL